MFRSIDLRKHALGILVALGAVFWIFNAGSHPHYNVREVSAQQAKSLIDAGAIVVDVRGEEQYKARHIPGSILIPLEVLRAGIPASLTALRAQNIIVYCGDGVTRGPESADLLNKAGFTQAANLEHGIESWESAGYPLQHG